MEIEINEIANGFLVRMYPDNGRNCETFYAVDTAAVLTRVERLMEQPDEASDEELEAPF